MLSLVAHTKAEHAIGWYLLVDGEICGVCCSILAFRGSSLKAAIMDPSFILVRLKSTNYVEIRMPPQTKR